MPSLHKPFALAEDAVQIWHADLTGVTTEASGHLALLDENERARAARLRIPEDRAQFVAAHALARMLAGAYLNCAAEAVGFEHAAKGKPYLLRGEGGPDIRFNASRTRGHTVFAFTLAREVGVDVERIAHRPQLSGLYARTMTAQEQKRLRALPTEEAQEKAFFAMWAQKEALMKAHGDGLGIAPSGIALSLTGEPVQLAGDTNRLWRVEEIAIHPAYAAAVAAEGAAWRVESVCSCTEWLDQFRGV